MKKKTGFKMDPFIRPPEGNFSMRSIKVAKSMGYSTIFWSLAYYDYDSYSMDDTRVAAPVFFKWVDAVEVKKISDSERIFLAKIPRKALKGKDGVNIEYRFNKNGDVIYSSQYNVILDKKKGLNEVEMSYYAGTDGVDVPEYNIYGK